MADMVMILTASAAGLSQLKPIRGTIAHTGKTLGVDQRLQQHGLDMILPLPITGHTAARSNAPGG